MKNMLFKENETLELKKSTSELKEAIISIVAILNKHCKGQLYFGIKNEGTIVGQDVSENTLREISKAISDHIEPKIYPKINKVILDGEKCIIVDFEGSERPYFAFGRAYIRVSDEDRQLSAKELENMIVRKNSEKLRWDYAFCEKASIKDISSMKVRRFLNIAGLKYNSVESGMEKLDLLKDGKLRNSALILFGKRPQQFFHNAKLRCAVFGTTDTTFVIDMSDFEGDLFYLIKKAEEYVLQNMHTGMRLEGLYRVDVPEIDKEALREAIINSFCHRDYYDYDSINIAIFKDRVEIRNPGMLYGGLTIDRILKENISRRRNEFIASMFNKIHFVEKWGRGIELILLKEPTTTFREFAGMFITTFKRKNVEKVTEKVTENQKIILELISKNKHITIAKMVAGIKISKKNVIENIKKLKQKGLLKRIGPDKGGYWEVER